MKTSLRSLLLALLGALAIAALSRIDTLRAQSQTTDEPPPTAAPPAAEPPSSGQPSTPPEVAAPAPGDRSSADNNVTFPVDI